MKDFNTKKEIGAYAESFVVSYLMQNGATILAQNYQKRCGEIDIIARKNSTLAFIEVKYRKNSYGYISDMVPRSKQLKIIKTAKSFLVAHNIYNYNIRFDIAFVQKSKKGYTLDYILNAFTE